MFPVWVVLLLNMRCRREERYGQPYLTGGEDNKFAFYEQTISCVKSVARNIQIIWLRAKGDKGFNFHVIA